MIAKTYQIQFNKKFLKDLQKIPEVFRRTIREKIAALATDPRPEGSKKLQGSSSPPLYRIRCGDYRVVYIIKDELLLVILIEMGHRRDIYR